MARSGLLFLHPVVEPDPLRKSNEYNESSREAALQAVTTWVRMQADTSKGHYRVWVAEGDLGEPKWRINRRRRFRVPLSLLRTDLAPSAGTLAPA